MRLLKQKRFAPLVVGLVIFAVPLAIEIDRRGGVYEWYTFHSGLLDTNRTITEVVLYSVRRPLAWFALLGAVVALFNFRDYRAANFISWSLISLIVFVPVAAFVVILFSVPFS